MVSLKGLVVCKSPPAGYIVGYLRDVKGGLGGDWEALIRILFMKRDSPIRRMGCGECAAEYHTHVVSQIPVLR